MDKGLFTAIDERGKVYIPEIREKEGIIYLTFKMSGGRPTFYFHSKFRYGAKNWMGDTDLVATDNASLAYAAEMIADSCREYEALRDLQLVYMKEYEVLDGGIQVATNCDGTRMVGNFSDAENTFEGHAIAPFDSIVLRG